MRLLIALAAPLALAAATVAAQPGSPAVAPSAAPGEALFVFSGRGYGHGVGMSQFGALGMANEGYAYDEILAYYYTGTELGSAAAKEVRVLLAEGRRALTIASTVPFTVVDALGTTYRIDAGALVLRSDLMLPSKEGPAPATGPLVVRPGKATPLMLDGRPYRGRLEVAAQGAFLRVVNFVGLESYLQGVVAGEMPQTWPLEALKAQAVAARSYALANLVKGKPFDLYADQRSQVYVGFGGEKPRASEAVRSTSGQVVLYDGAVASTLYFSSSGGRTANAADVFGVPVPYLVSRPDPWDKASPYYRWGPVLFGARTVQAKLGVPARVLDAAGVPTPSGRLRALTLQTTTGPTTVPSGLLRTGLGLRSTWVTIGVLRLDRPRGPVVFGSSLLLTGIARGLASPLLSVSEDGSTWEPVGTPEPAAGGSIALTVRPARTARYRLEARGAVGSALLVRVAPRVRLLRPSDLRMLEGSVRPRLAGALVMIEWLDTAGWTPVADALVDESGAFRAEFALVPGSYRARVLPFDGFAEGLTPVLTVSG